MLELRNVTKRYGRVVALECISLEIEPGSYVCVVGHTSAGKSTLLKVIAGVVKHDSGEVLDDGKPMSPYPAERPVGYMPQDYALFPHMTVLENVMYGPVRRGKSRQESRQIAIELLERVGLDGWENAYPQELSGGMQQRVALARALAVEPKYLLLDEPLSALDAVRRVELHSWLKKITEGITVLHVTHDQEEAMGLADMLVVLRDGKIAGTGKPEELYRSPPDMYVANFLGETNFYPAVAHDGQVSIFGHKFESGRLSGPVVIGIRPEDVVLDPSGGCEATVEDVVLVSAGAWRHVLSINGVSLVAVFGRKVLGRVNVKIKRAMVFPYPPEGIRRAINLE